MKMNARLAVDFTGERKSFGVMSFSTKTPLDNAPSFVRLDEYDSPAEPNMDMVREVLTREYPNQFPS